MKAKVRLTHTVELFVESESIDKIQDWLAGTTPEEAYMFAYNNGRCVESNYEEDIICEVRDDSEVDYVIKGKNNMKTWKIPVVWQEMGIVVVEANTLEEAIEIARADDGVIPIPDDGSFLEGSWEVDCEDEDFLRKFYNNNQKDEEN